MAAGLGFKTFTSGEVLTAADTNGYLMQGINVFANASARTAAITSPQEGQYSYLKDTNALEYYDGAAWVGAPVGDITAVTAGKGLTGGGSSGDVTVSLGTTAKGDLVAGSGASTAAVLSVGNNGETLVADSSTSTGLRYQGNFAAGKNKIINGDFGIWQRGTSFTNLSGYGPDRFSIATAGGSGHIFSQQTFTPGTAPVAGYEGQYFARLATAAGATYFDIVQKIEDVRTFAGQTITFSFWAKASSSVTMVALLRQQFGTGGSANVDKGSSGFTFTSSWNRYSFTITLDSIAGKTIGTGSSLQAYLYTSGGTVASNNIDLWGWQVEASNTATAFNTATGTIQGELAMCQRYYWRTGGDQAVQAVNTNAVGGSTTVAYGVVINPVTMRTAPTSVDFSLLWLGDGVASFNVTSLTILTNGAGRNSVLVTLNAVSGLVQYRPYYVITQGTTAGYLGFSAEL